MGSYLDKRGMLRDTSARKDTLVTRCVVFVKLLAVLKWDEAAHNRLESDKLATGL